MAASAAPQTAAAEWHRYWPLVLATASGMALAAMLTSSFGVMLEPIEREFAWSRAQISSGPAIVSMMGLVLAAPAGYLIDRFGSRLCGIVVVTFSLAASIALGFVETLWHWRAAWAIFGIPAAFTTTVWVSPVSTIFDKGRGMAIAITISGVGISQALVPPVAEYFVQNFGWRIGFISLGAIWCSVVMPLVVAFMPKKGGRFGAAEKSHDGRVSTQHSGFGPIEGLKRPAFYLLFFAALLSAMTGMAVILNLVPVLTFTGLNRADAVWIAGSMGIASIIGRLVGGWLMDRYDVRRLAIAASVVSLIFPIGLISAPGVTWIAIVAMLSYGLTGGMKLNAIVYLTRVYLGARSFGFLYGTISIATSVAMGIAPLIANYIYDVTQSYWLVIWAVFPGFIGSGLLFYALGARPDFNTEV